MQPASIGSPTIGPRSAVALLPLLAVAAVALMLTYDSAAHPATASDAGPEMVLTLPGGDCDVPARPTKCTVAPGAVFDLSVEVATAPVAGYIAIQTYLAYGTSLIYKPADTPLAEITWPDCSESVVVHGSIPGNVHHGCTSGLFNPPVSNYLGQVVQLSFTCSAIQSATEVMLLAYGDPVAGTDGAAFRDIDDVLTVPKVGSVTINCSDAPSPTATNTASSDLTDTPAPALTASPTLTSSPVTTATPTSEITPTTTAASGPTSTPPPTFTPAATWTPEPTWTPQPTWTPNLPPTATPTPTFTLTPTPAPLAGDTNCDGVVTPIDATFVLQWWAGLFAALPCPVGGDANGDGVTTILDATVILQFYAGLIDSLPP